MILNNATFPNQFPKNCHLINILNWKVQWKAGYKLNFFHWGPNACWKRLWKAEFTFCFFRSLKLANKLFCIQPRLMSWILCIGLEARTDFVRWRYIVEETRSWLSAVLNFEGLFFKELLLAIKLENCVKGFSPKILVLRLPSREDRHGVVRDARQVCWYPEK